MSEAVVTMVGSIPHCSRYEQRCRVLTALVTKLQTVPAMVTLMACVRSIVYRDGSVARMIMQVWIML